MRDIWAVVPDLDAAMQERLADVLETRRRRPRVVRVNLGKRSAQLRVNGEAVPFENSPEPIGFEFTRGGEPEELPSGERPCA